MRQMGRWSVLGLLVLGACGGRAQDSMGAAGSSSGGSVTAGGDAAGSAGEAPELLAADITGRWGLFDFEDPVGVQLTQTGTLLGGRGCDVGAPPLAEDHPEYCGPISGSVSGQQAKFGFHFQGSDYLTEVTVSADGQRMTGRFHGAADWMPQPMAWLRVPDGELWLTTPKSSGQQRYSLELVRADGDEYTAEPNEWNLLDFWYHGGISSPLGAFWNTETRLSADGSTLDVGPVPLTTPELAVSMSIHIEQDELTDLTAITGSGHHYEFELTRTN